MMRKYDTCFFERYAQISLETLLGKEFECLQVEDRPDLQSADGASIGIEVTRAMEQSKEAASGLLKEMAGVAPLAKDGKRKSEEELIARSGYTYGLREGRYVGSKEYSFWAMALPLRHILKSKVSKCVNGFYGEYKKMGLYVFCKENLNETDVIKAYKYVMSLQEDSDIRYNRLYLSDISALHVCNLEDGLSEAARVVDFPIPQEMRKEFYLKAFRQQMDELSGSTCI